MRFQVRQTQKKIISLFTNTSIGYFILASFASIWSRFQIIDRYIVLEILRPLFACLLFLVSIFIVSALQEHIGGLLTKGIPFEKILIFLFSILIEKLPQTLPVTVLFSSLLAANRLSSDLELVAMRSIGMSYNRIYANFIIVGFLLCAFMASLNFFISPLLSKSRRQLTEQIALYHSIGFVQPGKFFNRPVAPTGKYVDIYAKERQKHTLQDVYIHRWNIDKIKDQAHTKAENKSPSFSKSKSLQIIYAKKGEMIARRIRKNSDNQKKKAATALEKSQLPIGLRDRDLLDVSFAALFLEHSNEQTTTKKYIRLHKGFQLALGPNRKQIQVTDFSEGFIDYSLGSPPRTQGYFSLNLHTLTLLELIEIYRKIHKGGLILDPVSVDTGSLPQAENYVELPRIELLPILQQRTKEISSLNPKEIYEKYRLYVREAADSPSKREAYFTNILRLSQVIVSKNKELIFEIHRRISSSLAIILFVVMALPLGISVKRSGKGASFSLALGIYAIYSIMTNSLELRFEHGDIHYMLATWLPEFCLLLLSLGLLYKTKKIY